MKTFRTTLIFVILLSLLAACTAMPGEAPAEPITEPATTDIPAAETGSLTANPWQWVAFVSPVEQYSVEEPQFYTLNFTEDGTVNIQADCNTAIGSYTTDGSSLTIVVGPMTRAACPEGSRSNDFVNYLNFTAGYFFKDGHLFIDLMADGGTLEFAPAAEQAPAEAPQATTLTGTVWQWVGFTNPVEQYTIADPQNYTLSFNDEGSVKIQADCNIVLGSYTSDGSSIQITLGPSTLMACDEDSQGDAFIQNLSSAAVYFFQDGHLFIDQFADSGTMEFAPAGEASAETATLTSNPWQWVAFTNPATLFTLDDSENYILTFNEDGTLNIQADCNTALGAYTTDGSSLKIELGPMTLVACPEGSRSDEFIKYLSFAAIYFFQGGHLYIDLFADGGTMEFAPAGPGAKSNLPHDMSPALVESLANGTYTGIFADQPVTLEDGYYFYDDGSSARTFVRFFDDLVATGDLDGDELEDAVVLLEDLTSGTGRFVYAVAIQDVNGNPNPTKAQLLGDRIQVKSLAIEDGQIVANLIAQGADDPACCASWNVRKLLALVDGALQETSSEELSKVSLDDLNGTSWRLVDLNSLVGEPPLPDADITLMFNNPSINGSAGCNTYMAGIQSNPDAPQSLTVGEIASTMMMCDEPLMEQESTYLGRLGKVTSWSFDAGRLALIYEVDGEYGSLLYEAVQ